MKLVIPVKDIDAFLELLQEIDDAECREAAASKKARTSARQLFAIPQHRGYPTGKPRVRSK